MKITSVFNDGEMIPSKYTADGENISPPLKISDVPGNTVSIVLIADDPDAPVGTWDHWIVFNIDPKITEIEEGTEPAGVKGSNSWGNTGYGGPAPPSGIHRYFFKIYALDILLDLPDGSTKKEIEDSMKEHILDKSELIGKYRRG